MGRSRVSLGVLAGVAVLGLLVAACGDGGSSTGTEGGAPSTTGGTSPADLVGSFTSTSVTGHDLAPGSQVVLTFEGDELGANAGCNLLGAPYELDGDTLSWPELPRATMMACEPALMDQDTWLTAWLMAGVTWSLDGDQLTLGGEGVTMVLQAAVVGGEPTGAWELETITSGDSASSVPADVEVPTLELTGEEVLVFTGCNSGGGSYQLGDGTITFDPLRLTMMACEGAAGEVEASVTAVLDGTVPYVVEGDSLTMGAEGATLVWRRA